MRVRITILTTLLGCAFAITTYGQGTTSRVTGRVADPNGASVQGATVSLTNEATSISFTTETTSTGVFTFDSVQVGKYTLAFEKSGFKKLVSTNNVVELNQPTTVDVTLEIGSVAEVVTVDAVADLVQTSTSGNYGATLDQRTILNAPIVGTRGRNPLQLINSLPGVVVGANTGGGVHVHGSRDRAFNFTLDGIDINETSAGGSNFSPLRTNPDMLAEMQVVTSNATAELGRSSGAQVSLATRSGTNDLHGSLFWFYQTPRFHANEWENNVDGINKRQFVQHIGGFSVGGPVFAPKFGEGGDSLYDGRNRTFFFFNMQGLRTSESRSVTSTVYTAQARQGLFRYVIGGRNLPAGSSAGAPSVDASGNVPPGINVGTYNVAASDPARAGLSPEVLALIGLTPLPNNFRVGDGLNTAGFTFTAPQKEAQEDFVFKIDHNFNPNNAVFVRYAWGRQDTLCDFVNNGQQRFPGTPCTVDTTRRPRNLAVNYRSTLSPRVTNEFVFGFNRFTFSFDNPDEQAESRLPLNLSVITNPFSYSQRVYNARSIRTYQFVDNLAFVLGSHTFKTGINFRLQQHVDSRASVAGGDIVRQANFSTATNTVDPVAFGLPANINTTFDRPRLQSMINELLGRIGSVSQSFVAVSDTAYGAPGTRFIFDARYPEYDVYFQDTWKLRPNLTLDLGLRWEIRFSPRGGGDSRIFHPDRPVRLGEQPSNAVTFVEGKLFDDDWNNFGPSVGLAWDPFSDGRTSVRANYRLAYDRTNTFVISSSIFQSVPGITQSVINTSFGQSGGRISQGLPQPAPPTNVTPAQLRQAAPFSNNLITTMDPSLSSPESHQWGVNVQREMRWNSVVELSYIGRRGTNLYGAYDVNQVDIFNNGFLNAFNAVRTAFLANPACAPVVTSSCSLAAGTSALINSLYSRDTRLRTGETGSQLVARLFPSELNLGSVGSVAQDITRRIQSGTPAYVLAGFSPSFFQPFPQFANGWRVIDSNDYSTYHALEAQVRRRFNKGIGYGFSYTLSKSKDTRSFDPTFTVVSTGSAQSASSTPFDLRNRRLNYALSDFDRRHAIRGFFTLELPFGKGRHFWSDMPGAVEKIVGGWEVSGNLYWLSGRPFTVYSGATTVSNVTQSPANCQACTPAMGRYIQENGFGFFFSQQQRAPFSTPAPGQLGNTGRNFFVGPPRFNMDAALIKRTRITERQNIEFRAEFQNITNTPSFGFPTATITSGTFGRIHDSVISSSRKVQFGLKYNF